MYHLGVSLDSENDERLWVDSVLTNRVVNVDMVLQGLTSPLVVRSRDKV